MKILVVDDDKASRHLVTSVARSAGHEVISAGDGIEALETARADRPDMLLTDILMPRMDGYQLVREWKADPGLAGVPVVFLTASYTDSADERFAMDLGAERFLTKPVEPGVLLAVIEEIAEGKGTEMHNRVPRIGEREILREYSDRLVRKLEQKVIELERTNGLLSSTMETLATELQVKTALIDGLGGRIDGHERELDSLRAHDELGKAADAAALIVVVSDRTGAIRFFGKGAELLTGYPAAEAGGGDAFAFFVPEAGRDESRAAFAELLAEGGSGRFESEITTARGEMLRVGWIVSCWRGETGDIAGAIAVGVPL